MRMLIVDDSVVFRSQIKAVAEQIPAITEIVLASNGKLALQRLESSDFDVMTLDLEMPEMNGLETLEAMRKLPKRPAVLVFSAQSSQGAACTIQAMDLGALDVLTKPQRVTNLEEAQQIMLQELLPRISGICQKLQKRTQASQPTRPAIPMRADRLPGPLFDRDLIQPEAIVIGASTGGPAALKAVLRSLRPPLTIPIFIVQHMPPLFTQSLAENLEQRLGIPAAEAQHQGVVLPNKIYVAPGDFHLSLKREGPNKIVTMLDQKEKRHSVRPAVDVLFETAAEVYGPQLLGLILTGMGQDGAMGCQRIKEKRGTVLIQDEASSAVWGMPGTVFRLGAYDKVCDLLEMEQILARTLGRAA
jgi:two-component system chemotaxis response regulator CheB